VEFLEVVIGKEGIKMEKEKIKAIVDWPVPKSVKEVQKFLGLANYDIEQEKDMESREVLSVLEGVYSRR